MMGSVVLSRILGIVREMVLAGFTGTSHQTDAYVAAFLLPEIVNHLLASGFMSVTFIPIFQKHLAEGNEERAWRAFSNLFCVGTVAMLMLIAAGELATRPLLMLMGKDVSGPEVLPLATRLTRTIIPAQLFFYWGSLLMAVQYARKRFFFPALAPLVYNVGIIAGGAGLYGLMKVEGFAWGVLAGSFLGSFALQVYGASRCGMRLRAVFDLRDGDLHRYVLLTLPFVLGLTGSQFANEILFRYFGSFTGEGGLASLNYSWRVMWALVGPFGQAFGVAMFPFLSSLAVKGQFAEMNRLSREVMTRIAAFVLPLAGVGVVLAEQIVAVLYQRGEFGAKSTEATAGVLVYYLAGSFLFAITPIVSRSFYAVQNTWLPAVVGTVTVVCWLPCYWLMARTLGAAGVAVAASGLLLVQFAVLVTLWRRRYPEGFDVLDLFKRLALCTAAALVGAGLCGSIEWALAGLGLVSVLGVLLGNSVVGIVAGVPSAAAALALLQAIGVVDIRGSLARLIRRRRPARQEQ